MGTPPTFDSLTEQQHKLLNSSYIFGSLATVSYFRRTNEIIIKAKGSQRRQPDTPGKSEVDFSGKIKGKSKTTKIEFKKRKDQTSMVTLWTKPELLRKRVRMMMQLRGHHDTNEFNGRVKVQYSSERINTHLTFGPLKYVELGTTFVTASKLGIGFVAGYDADLKRMKAYDLALWKTWKDTKIVAKHKSIEGVDGLGNIILSYWQKVSNNTQVGGQIISSVHSNNTEFAFGMQRKIEDGFAKWKFDSEGNLAIAVGRKLSDKVRLVSAVQLALNSPSTPNQPTYSLGFRFDFK